MHRHSTLRWHRAVWVKRLSPYKYEFKTCSVCGRTKWGKRKR